MSGIRNHIKDRRLYFILCRQTIHSSNSFPIQKKEYSKETKMS